METADANHHAWPAGFLDTRFIPLAGFGSACRQVLAVQPQDAWTISPATNGTAEACAGPEAQRLRSADRSPRTLRALVAAR